MPVRVPTVKNTVLLVCDIQERFRSAIYGFDAMTSTIVKLVRAAGLLEIPVLTTEQNPKALGSTVSEIGSQLWTLPPGLNLGVFPKTKFSMVLPEVQGAIRDRKIENAIIVGIESHVCVLQSTLELLHQGTQVYIPAEGVSSCNKQEVPLALSRLSQAGGIITSSESILFQLMGDASLPAFRHFARLIKEEKNNTAKALEILVGGDTTIKSHL